MAFRFNFLLRLKLKCIHVSRVYTYTLSQATLDPSVITPPRTHSPRFSSHGAQRTQNPSGFHKDNEN